jgi:hypothetical protein
MALTIRPGKTFTDDKVRYIIDSNREKGKTTAPTTRRRDYELEPTKEEDQGKNGDKGTSESGRSKTVKCDAGPLREEDCSQTRQNVVPVARGGSPPAISAPHVHPRVARRARCFPSKRSTFF